eukprot:TRINITY_DN13908_c0_g1_i1.p1 TRINITY_DN13908_c0_g1~~TRINITY_DN13908_c0_g1_i1.p1  ORF type:complete len:316 (+),score=43.62 TRINITY_DN13908_c0_g1_i1:94-1041(+)
MSLGSILLRLLRLGLSPTEERNANIASNPLSIIQSIYIPALRHAAFFQLISLLVSLVSFVLRRRKRPSFIPPLRNPASFYSNLPQYSVSTVHASVVAVQIVPVFVALLRCYPNSYNETPTAEGTAPSADSNFLSQTITRCIGIAYVMVGYFFQDLAQVLWHYPRLGGVDVVVHHLVHLVSLTAGIVHRSPMLPFSWLVLTEATTPLQNVRWLLRSFHRPPLPLADFTPAADASARGLATADRAAWSVMVVAYFAFRVMIPVVGTLDWMTLPVRDGPEMLHRLLVVAGTLLNVRWFTRLLQQRHAVFRTLPVTRRD